MFTKKTITIEELLAQEEAQKSTENVDLYSDFHINDISFWPSQPKSKRKLLTDETAKETCLSNCCGLKKMSSRCCYLDPIDLQHIIGPIDEHWIKKTIKHFSRITGNKYTRHDFVIDVDEGKIIENTYFSSKISFNNHIIYPIMRMQIAGPRFACKFLNIYNGKCAIYKTRPEICQNYYCEYIKTNFLVRTKDAPNIYKILR